MRVTLGWVRRNRETYMYMHVKPKRRTKNQLSKGTFFLHLRKHQHQSSFIFFVFHFLCLSTIIHISDTFSGGYSSKHRATRRQPGPHVITPGEGLNTLDLKSGLHEKPSILPPPLYFFLYTDSQKTTPPITHTCTHTQPFFSLSTPE